MPNKLLKLLPAFFAVATLLQSTVGETITTSFGYTCAGKPDCGACADGPPGFCTAGFASSICIGLGFGPGAMYTEPAPAIPGDCTNAR